MQQLVLRLDYASSSRVEALQQHLYPGQAKPLLQMPHIPLMIFQQTPPHLSKAVLEPVLQPQASFHFSGSDVGFAKNEGQFYLQISSPLLSEFIRLIHSATQEGRTARLETSHLQPRIPLTGRILPHFWGPLFARLALELTPISGTVVAVECWSVIGSRTTIDWTVFLSN